MKKIIIDLMGGDEGVTPLLSGAKEAAKEHPDIEFILVGPEEEVAAAASEFSNIQPIYTTDYVKPDEPPTCIFNGRDEASMVKAVEALKADPEAVGLLSSGNTGALLVSSSFRLGLIKGLKMPALASNLRAKNGEWFCLLDCGANINCEPKDLAQFALLGNAFAKAMYKKDAPRVALLNVGREEKKGNEFLLSVFPLLKELPLNFIGNAEGYDAIDGYADVVVADGFAGNLLLKCMEASGQAAMDFLRKELESSDEAKDVLTRILNAQSEMFDLNKKGGAIFLGTKKPIIKMHGCAVSETVVSCVNQLLTLTDGGFDRLIADATYTGSAQE